MVCGGGRSGGEEIGPREQVEEAERGQSRRGGEADPRARVGRRKQ